MAESRLSIIGANNGTVFDSFEFGRDSSRYNDYQACLAWAERYAALLILEYARIETDFDSKLSADIFIKEDAISSTRSNSTFRA